jgi:hypothetical protein
MTITLRDSRWPELAAAVKEWSGSALKALDLAASLTIDKAGDDHPTTAESHRDGRVGSETKHSH